MLLAKKITFNIIIKIYRFRKIHSILHFMNSITYNQQVGFDHDFII